MKNKMKLIGYASMALVLIISACKKEDDVTGGQSEIQAVDASEKGLNPDEAILHEENARHRFEGFIYTVGNEAGINNIHMYKQNANGSLTHLGATASGGAGSASGLGSQGALALSGNNNWLVAVNAGDNSVSSFRVHNNGTLTLTDTESSGGVMPVSVCIRHNRVYVVNFGSDNIQGYTIDNTGNLTPIAGTNVSLVGNATEPAQIAFGANGHYLYVTQKATNTITSFQIGAGGAVVATNSTPSVGMTPFGFEIARNAYMVVSNAEGGMPNASSVTSYSGVNSGNLVAVNGDVENNQSAACWVALTHYDRFAYITNTGSDNISTYYVSPWGALYLLHANAVTTGDEPLDICVARNNYYVYNINGGSNTITGFRRAFLGDLVSIGSTPGLPDFAAGLVAW